ncbi:MAG: hypothetical protein Q8R29_02950 [bacterium]|nr:hypothetical protein [bacterium]
MKLFSGKIYPVVVALFGFLPLIADAQARPSEINNIITTVSNTAKSLIGLLFVLATVVFLYGVVIFIAKADDEAARKKARGVMTWGIVGMAVMASGWGLASILVNYFGVSGGGPNVSPTNILPRGLR